MSKHYGSAHRRHNFWRWLAALLLVVMTFVPIWLLVIINYASGKAIIAWQQGTTQLRFGRDATLRRPSRFVHKGGQD